MGSGTDGHAMYLVRIDNMCFHAGQNVDAYRTTNRRAEQGADSRSLYSSYSGTYRAANDTAEYDAYHKPYLTSYSATYA